MNISVSKAIPEILNGNQKPLPVGGTDAHKFNCLEVWYPLFFVEDLDKTKPTLSKIKSIRLGLIMLAAVLWSLTPLITISIDPLPTIVVILSSMISLVSVVVYWWLGKLERKFFEGQIIAPRNFPEK